MTFPHLPQPFGSSKGDSLNSQVGSVGYLEVWS